MAVYCNETEFYRKILGIAYETGSHLRRTGVITPDGQLSARSLALGLGLHPAGLEPATL